MRKPRRGDPLEQPRANESGGSAGAQNRGDNSKRVHAALAFRAENGIQFSGLPLSQRAPRA